MKILLTGGKGYVGSKLKAELERKGHAVYVYDLPEGDILDKEALDTAVKGMDSVYHLAALANLLYTDANPDKTFEVNIIGLHNVIGACVKNNVILNFISTCCIYGNALELPSREESSTNPSDAYAHTKAAGEHTVKQYGLSKGLKYNILRLGTVYGESTDPDMRDDMCIQKFLKKVKNEEPLQIDGSGKQTRNYIHIDDLAEGLALVTEKETVNETINFAGVEHISVLDIAEECYKASGKEPLPYTYRPERKDDFRYQHVSIEKALRILGWYPKRIFSESVKRNYDNWR